MSKDLSKNIFVDNHCKLIPSKKETLHNLMYYLLHEITPRNLDDHLYMTGVSSDEKLGMIFSDILKCLSFKKTPDYNNFNLSITDHKLNINYDNTDINFEMNRYPHSIVFGGARSHEVMKDIINDELSNFINILNRICEQETIKYNDFNLHYDIQDTVLIEDDFNF